MRRADVSKRVFLNVPYDTEFEPLYLAYIIGVVAFDMTPVLAISQTDGVTRVDRIYNLLVGCRHSIHDLSRIKLSKEGELPRFNMPFELGIAVCLAKKSASYSWSGFDSKRYQAARTLSDLAGTDFLIHRDSVKGVFAGLCDVFVKKGMPSVPLLLELHETLTLSLPSLQKECGADSLYSARMLTELIQAAQDGISKLPVRSRI
jgi:hypothetical protein